jgi:hypothetical protein
MYKWRDLAERWQEIDDIWQDYGSKPPQIIAEFSDFAESD